MEACLIVKDEAANLPKCLSSLERLGSVVRAVNVYDTGSSDDTIAIATAAGCRVRRGFWDGDFSRARNASLDMVTSPWALIVDADEVVHADPRRLEQALGAATELDVLDASLTHVDERGRSIGHSSYGAVLRADAVRYVGRIHEVALRADGAPTRTAAIPEDVLTFVHTGYASAEIRRAKVIRNTAAAELGVREALNTGDPQRLGEARYHYARSLARLDPEDDAVLEEYRRAWTAFAPGSTGRDRVMAGLVPELLRRGRVDDATAEVGAHLGAGGSPVLGRWLVAQVAVAQGRHAVALSTLAAIPADGAPEADVDPREVLGLRMQVLDALGRDDEALACCVLLVARWGVTLRVPDLLLRVAGQEAGAVAALLADTAGGQTPNEIVAALAGADALGREVARHLA